MPAASVFSANELHQLHELYCFPLAENSLCNPCNSLVYFYRLLVDACGIVFSANELHQLHELYCFPLAENSSCNPCNSLVYFYRLLVDACGIRVFCQRITLPPEQRSRASLPERYHSGRNCTNFCPAFIPMTENIFVPLRGRFLEVLGQPFRSPAHRHRST